MKKILSAVVLLLVCCISYAQLPIDPKTEKVTYTDVVNVDLTKDELFMNAKMWITNTFKDYKETIQFEDKDAGKISIKGNFKVDLPSLPRYQSFYFFNRYDFTLTIECKDNRYRYTITDIKYTSSSIKPSALSLEFAIFSKENTQEKLDKLKLIDTSKYSKKELKKYNEQLEDIKEDMTEYLYLEDKVNKEFENLITSLTETMSIKDDF